MIVYNQLYESFYVKYSDQFLHSPMQGAAITLFKNVVLERCLRGSEHWLLSVASIHMVAHSCSCSSMHHMVQRYTCKTPTHIKKRNKQIKMWHMAIILAFWKLRQKDHHNSSPAVAR